MVSVIDILYNLLRFLGLIEEPAPMRQNIKRNRVYDDFSSDDETAVLGHKQVKRFRLSDIIAINDNLDKDVTHNNCERNVPVQVESSYSTSTPKDTHKSVVPDDLPGLSRNGTSMLVRKTFSKHTETETAAEQKEQTVGSKLENKQKESSILQVNLDEDDSDSNQQDDDVVFVEEGTTPPTSPPLPKDNHAEAVNDKILSRILKALKPEENIDCQELLQLIATSKKPIVKRKPISDGKSTDGTSSGSPQKIQVLNKIKSNSELNVGKKNVPKEYDPVRISSSDSSDSDVEVVPPESSSTSSIKEDLERKSRNWLLELDTTYNNVRKTQENISDARRVSDITSKVNSDQNIARSSRTNKTDTSEVLLKLGSEYNKPDKPKTQEKPNDYRRTANFTPKEKSEQCEARSSSPETIDEWLAKLDAKYFSKPTEKPNDAQPNAAQSSKPDKTEDWLSKLESKYKTDQPKSQTKLRDGVPEPESISKGNTEHDATKKWLARLEAEYFSSSQKTRNNVANNALHDSNIIPNVNDEQNDVVFHRLESKYDNDLPKTQDQFDGALRETNLTKENSGANAVRSYLPTIAQNWLSELDAKYNTASMNQDDEPRSAKPASLDDWLADLKSRCKVPHMRQPEPIRTNRKSETEPKVNREKSDVRSHELDTARERLLKLNSKHKTEQSKNQIILDDTNQVVKNISNENSEQREVRSFKFNTSEDLMMKLGALYDNYQKESHRKSKNSSEQKRNHRNSTGDDSDMEMQCNVGFELPALTPEQQALVKRGLQPKPEDEMLIEKFNMRIHRRDLLTLSDENWLNDEVINFYMNLIMQRSEERKDLPKVYATNTFFYDKLMQSGQAGLRRWTRKVDIFAYDLFLVPVNIVRHWCLCLVDFRKRVITYLDSRGQPNQECLDALLQYLKDEHQDKKRAPFDESGWKTECPTDIPQQMNGSDCGMFACTFAEFSSRDAAYSFTQAHMPYLRRKAALEILTGKLLL